MQTLDSSVAATQLSDRLAAAVTSRAARRTASTRGVATATRGRVALRPATAQDDAAVTRLAALDGARRPAGDLLVAELDDEIVAAVPFAGGRAIADPFRPTAELVDLLRLRVGLLAAPAPARRLRRLRPHLRLRIAA